MNENKEFLNWAELDLNQRRQTPAELQSAPINRSGIDPYLSSTPIVANPERKDN